MPMYNLIEYSNAYSKTSGSLWQYYRYQPALVLLLISLIITIIVFHSILSKK